MVASQARHEWFLRFEKEFRQHFQHLARQKDIDAVAHASEDDWKVWTPHPRGEGELGMTLPHSYAKFQPLAVALNAAARLVEMLESARSSRLTPY